MSSETDANHAIAYLPPASPTRGTTIKAQHHATLGFHRGTSLDDPQELLEGTGKEMRHVKLKSAGEVDAAALESLVKQAAGP